MGADTGHTFAVRPAIFEDGFGKRHHADAPGGEPLEVLELRDDFTTEIFEAAVRERMRPLAGVHSTWFSTVRTVQRIQQNGSKLFVVYDRAPGARLSTVLATAREPQTPIDVNAALCIVRQLLTAVALLHQKLPTFAHGALAADRVIITSKARVVVADHVLGSALERFGASPEWYWNELRVPVPPTTPVAFDQRVDVMQIGVLALELMLGRPLGPTEYPDEITELTARAWTTATDDGRRPLAAELLVWLRRMLQLPGEEGFASAMDAWAELEHLLGSDNGASFAALERLMLEYERTTVAATAQGPAPLSIVARRDSSRRVAVAQPAAAVGAASPVIPAPDQPLSPLEVVPASTSTSFPQGRATSQLTEMASTEAHPRLDASVADAAVSSFDGPIAMIDDGPARVGEPNALSRSEIDATAPIAFSTASAERPFPEATAALPVSEVSLETQLAADYAEVSFADTPEGAMQTSVDSAHVSEITGADTEAPPSAAWTTTPPVPSAAVPSYSSAIFAERSVPVADAPDGHAAVTHAAGGRRRIIGVAAAVVLLLGAALFGRSYVVPSAAAEAPGTLVVNTSPDGYQVFVDGKPRGVTPLSVELTPGVHELKIATEGEPRVIAFTVASGSTVSHTIEIPKASPRTGQLTVRSDPPGARVSIDGNPSGTAPLTLAGLTPGQHTVLLESELGSVSQEVIIEPGNTASLVVPMASSAGVPVSGWISVEAPAEVHIREDGHLVGTSQSDRIMVAAGKHELEIVNEALGYRARRTVTVAPGKVSAIRLDWPKGSMALNAQPWADVWVNGEKVGETPVGNIVVPIGTHDVVFRHPELGERTVRTTVTTGTPARVTVDMRQR